MTANVIGALVVICIIALAAFALDRDRKRRERYERRWVEALEENDGYGHDR